MFRTIGSASFNEVGWDRVIWPGRTFLNAREELAWGRVSVIGDVIGDVAALFTLWYSPVRYAAQRAPRCPGGPPPRDGSRAGPAGHLPR